MESDKPANLKPKYALAHYYNNRDAILQKRRDDRKAKRLANGQPEELRGRPRTNPVMITIPSKYRENEQVMGLASQLQTLLDSLENTNN